MDINQKIAKIPFWILFSILSFIVSWDFLFTYFTLKNNPSVGEGNPVSLFIINNFGLNYFLFWLPISLIILYGIVRLGAWMVANVDKRPDLNGKNHVTIMIILLAFPNVFRQMIKVFFDVWIIKGWNLKYSFISGFTLMIIYIILTEYITPKRLRKK